MKYFKITAYLYLIASAFFVYRGVETLMAGEEWQKSIIWFLIAGLSLFSFFFRLNRAKKFGDKK